MQVQRVNLKNVSHITNFKSNSDLKQNFNSNVNNKVFSSSASNAIKSSALASINFTNLKDVEYKKIQNRINEYSFESQELAKKVKIDIAAVKDRFIRRYFYHNDAYDLSKMQIARDEFFSKTNNTIYGNSVIISEPNEDGTKNEYAFSKGKLIGYTENLTIEDGVMKFDKKYRVYKDNSIEYFENASVSLNDSCKNYGKYIAIGRNRDLQMAIENLSFSPDGRTIAWNRCIKYELDENKNNQIYDYSEQYSNKKGHKAGLKTDFRNGQLVAYKIGNNNVDFVE